MSQPTKNTDFSDEARLAIRCQLGERDAWDTFVRYWNPRLWRFVSGMLSDPCSAENVLQEAWLRIVRSFSRMDDPERIGAWLFRIARNSVMDELRRRYRQPKLDAAMQVDDLAGPADNETRHGTPTASELGEWIKRGMDRLDPIEREAVALHYIEELPVDSVAEICNVPSGTVKSRLHRARQQLKRMLEAQE